MVDTYVGNQATLGQVEAEVSTPAIEGVRRVDQLQLEVDAKLGHVQLLVPIAGGAEHHGLGEDGEEVGDAPVPLHLGGSPPLEGKILTARFNDHRE